MTDPSAASPRPRDLGLDLPGRPGPGNAITDVAGVEVGTRTLIRGEGPLVTGSGPVRTGVTAILPRGRAGLAIPCAAGSAVLNGNGELTGLAWIEEAGELQTPITLTNTHSCGVARDATLRWMVARAVGTGQDWGLPVAGETYDGDLNDINGFHVTAEDVIAALDDARPGPVARGSQGGGTGMICYDFKGGNGSASRLVRIAGCTFTVGVFVQANFGRREHFTLAGRRIGSLFDTPRLRSSGAGSVIAIVATDAPLLPHQLKRIARRVPLGLARTGTVGDNSSGDLFLAFSTANAEALASGGAGPRAFLSLPSASLDPLFEATVEATEEAVLDAIIGNRTMTGRDGNTAHALPLDRLAVLMGTR